MVVIPSKLARELGVSEGRVLRLVKWYALSKGKRPEDFIRKYGGHRVYAMPDDFRDFVIRELRKDGVLE